MEPAIQLEQPPYLLRREPVRRVPPPRNPGAFYQAMCLAWRGCFACTMRVKSHGMDRTAHPGGLLLAVSHIGHLDPVLVSVESHRRIGWMSRQEFFETRLSRWFLRAVGAFPVRRRGCAASAIREALRRLERGEVVGIFPEGEVMSGPRSVVHGGPIRHGVALLAARSGCPVLPVVVAGTDRLAKVGPWLPARRGRLWIRAGAFMTAPPEALRREGRAEFAARLEAAFRNIYREMLDAWDLPPDIVPK